MKLKFKSALIAGMTVLFISNFAHAVALEWTEKNSTVIVDNTVQITKPSHKWDTQTKHYKDSAPVKWVRHVRGANPQIFLRYRTNVKGKTAHDYAKHVKKELANRGITVYNTENKVINNRHVTFLKARNNTNEEYLFGVWRHRNIGFILECLAESDKMASYMNDFNRTIASVKIIKESGL